LTTREGIPRPPFDLLHPYDASKMVMRPANPAVGNWPEMLDPPLFSQLGVSSMHLTPPTVLHMNTLNSPLRLLRQKRSSALIDARRIEAHLSRLSNSAATAGMRINLVCIEGMFRDYIATLDEAIGISVVKLRELSALPN
jgi:hypothetical protein